MIFVYSVFVLIAIFLLSTALYAGITTAPYVATRKQLIQQILEVAELTHNEFFYDLGCGDGRFLVVAVKKFGARAVGCDISLFRFLISKMNIVLHGCSHRVEVVWRNLYSVDVRPADVVFVWLTPRALIKLEDKFNRELKSGARVVVYSSPLPFWKPIQIVEPPYGAKIFLYIKK